MHKLSKLFATSSLSILLTTLSAFAIETTARKFSFPTACPMGRLNVMVRRGPRGAEIVSEVTAIGNVTVNVPPPEYLQLDVNPHCIEKPEQLKNMPIEGIDDLRISYMSMDEDLHVCDKALAAIPLFKNPLIFGCFRTDVTDAGLLNFKSLSKVVRLDCYMTTIDGSFLKDFKRLQNLEYLDISHNVIKETYLTNLKELKNLRRLNLMESNLSNAGLTEVCKVIGLKQLTIDGNKSITYDGMRHLSQLVNLESLKMGSNPHVTDDVIPTLQTLKGLQSLNVSQCNVTADGLSKLKNLKLKKLYYPDGFKVSDLMKLKKELPLTTLVHGGQVTQEKLIQFAPTRKF